MQANPGVLDFLPYMDGGVFSCQAEECLFIDDREENVAVARELGMQVVRFEGYEQARAVTNSMINA